MKCIKIVKRLEFGKEKMAPLRFFKTLVNGMVAMAKKFGSIVSPGSLGVYFFLEFISYHHTGGGVYFIL